MLPRNKSRILCNAVHQQPITVLRWAYLAGVDAAPGKVNWSQWDARPPSFMAVTVHGSLFEVMALHHQINETLTTNYISNECESIDANSDSDSPSSDVYLLMNHVQLNPMSSIKAQSNDVKTRSMDSHPPNWTGCLKASMVTLLCLERNSFVEQRQLKVLHSHNPIA